MRLPHLSESSSATAGLKVQISSRRKVKNQGLTHRSPYDKLEAMKFNFQVRELRAAELFRSADQTRLAICGLHLEHRPGEPSVVVATDGRRIVAIASNADQDEVPEPASLDLDIDTVNMLKAILNLQDKPFVDVGISDEKDGVSIRVGRDFFSTPNTPLSFPKWRSLFEQFQTPKPSNLISINAEFLHSFAQAAEILEVGPVNCTLTGDDSAVKIWCDKFPNLQGLVMPLHLGLTDHRDAYPQWLKA